jgi:hypothetical protein
VAIGEMALIAEGLLRSGHPGYLASGGAGLALASATSIVACGPYRCCKDVSSEHSSPDLP